MRIDLHGLTEQQAIMRISNALYSFASSEEWTEIEFITGQGLVLRGVLEDFLNREGVAYYQPSHNRGAYIVSRSKRRF